MRITPGTVPSWFDPDDDRAARAVWSRLAEPGDVRAGQFVERFGAATALRLIMQLPPALSQGELIADPRRSGEPRRNPAAKEEGGPQSPAPRWAVRLSDADPGRDLDTLHAVGGRVVIPGDPEWPESLDRLGPRAPFCLWLRGPLSLTESCRRSAALVGARAASPYGEHVAGELAAGCADRQITVVSGAAYGIDGFAHRGALAAGGDTVAVLASGIDRPYPSGHQLLVERIAAEGLVVSEVPPGSSPTRWRFVERNRLIAVISTVTVVVEAGWRSGASITAREAADHGRTVAAVPGSVTAATSAGCHRLLRLGAVCVTDAAEVAELVAEAGAQLPVRPDAPASEHDDLDPFDVRVLDAVPLQQPASVQAIARTAGLERSAVAAAIGRLEMRGLATGVAGRWHRVRPEPKQPPAVGAGAMRRIR